jgi:hypothetical protein
MGLKVFIVVIMGTAIVVAAVTGNRTSFEPSSVDRRICAVGRDIAADYGVTDTFERSQERVGALESRYGSAASPTIAAALISWSTNVRGAEPDLDLAFATMTAFTDSCAEVGL